MGPGVCEVYAFSDLLTSGFIAFRVWPIVTRHPGVPLTTTGVAIYAPVGPVIQVLPNGQGLMLINPQAPADFGAVRAEPHLPRAITREDFGEITAKAFLPGFISFHEVFGRGYFVEEK